MFSPVLVEIPTLVWFCFLLFPFVFFSASPCSYSQVQVLYSLLVVMHHHAMQVVGIGSKLAPPAKYSGEMGLCRTFLIDCSINFELTPHAFPTDRSKIAFMVSHMTGRAKA